MPRGPATGVERLDWRLISGLGAAQIVSWGALYYAFPVLLTPMQQDLGWSSASLVAGHSLAVVVSGVAAFPVGRLLDRRAPRPLMAAGSVTAAAATLAWSQVGAPAAYFAVWAAIGLIMAAVLYEPAFVVLAKRSGTRATRSITALTLIAGFASFVCQPLVGALESRYGWRTALVVMAGLVAAVTVPIHWVVLREPADGRDPTAAAGPSRRGAREAGRRLPELAEARFRWLLAAFVANTVTSAGLGVHLISYLVRQGWSAERAALAGGTLGAMQVPGRVAFGAAASRLDRARLAPGLLALPGMGALALVAAGRGPAVWLAVALLGVGQGVGTLLRATLLAELYGAARYGSVAGAAAAGATIA
ncbi:MAG: MFS transporter, partial [Acidimicrobiales bacterium]